MLFANAVCLYRSANKVTYDFLAELCSFFKEHARCSLQHLARGGSADVRPCFPQQCFLWKLFRKLSDLVIYKKSFNFILTVSSATSVALWQCFSDLYFTALRKADAKPNYPLRDCTIQFITRYFATWFVICCY